MHLPPSVKKLNDSGFGNKGGAGVGDRSASSVGGMGSALGVAATMTQQKGFAGPSGVQNQKLGSFPPDFLRMNPDYQAMAALHPIKEFRPIATSLANAKTKHCLQEYGDLKFI